MDAQRHKDYRDYAWNYFSVHAAQRMSVFQFFITLATATVGGGVLIAGSAENRHWSAALFLLLPLLAFIFWRLDQRTRILIRNAESALKRLERHAATTEADSPPELSLFLNDEATTERGGNLSGHFSYSRSFQYVFLATATIGISAAAIAIASGETESASGRSHLSTINLGSPQALGGRQGTSIELESGVAFTLRANGSPPPPAEADRR